MGNRICGQPQQVLQQPKDHFACRKPGCMEYDHAIGKKDCGWIFGSRGGLQKNISNYGRK